MYVNLDEVTELQDSTLFRPRQTQWRAFEKDKAFINAITFEMDFDLQVVERDIFTILDLLADLGGLTSILISGFAGIVAIFNWDGVVDNFLIKKLYSMT